MDIYQELYEYLKKFSEPQQNAKESWEVEKSAYGYRTYYLAHECCQPYTQVYIVESQGYRTYLKNTATGKTVGLGKTVQTLEKAQEKAKFRFDKYYLSEIGIDV